MKLQLIGTSNMRSSNNSASYIVDDKIIIDMPNGICKNLYKLNIKLDNISYILITHFHGDHYFDIPFYLLENKFVNIYCSQDGEDKIKSIMKLAFLSKYNITFDDNNVKFNFNNEFILGKYSVKKYEVDHGNIKPCYGYVLSNNNVNVGFTGDSGLCDNIETMASICNYLICDCTLINGDNKHMGIDNILYLAKKYSKCKFITSHMKNETREELLKYDFNNIIVPNDFDIFNIE